VLGKATAKGLQLHRVGHRSPPAGAPDGRYDVRFTDSCVMPQVPDVDSPGASEMTAVLVRKAFGGQVIGSTARARRATSGSGSPVKSMRYG
jgi:hypothetical protein